MWSKGHLAWEIKIYLFLLFYFQIWSVCSVLLPTWSQDDWTSSQSSQSSQQKIHLLLLGEIQFDRDNFCAIRNDVHDDDDINSIELQTRYHPKLAAAVGLITLFCPHHHHLSLLLSDSELHFAMVSQVGRKAGEKFLDSFCLYFGWWAVYSGSRV